MEIRRKKQKISNSPTQQSTGLPRRSKTKKPWVKFLVVLILIASIGIAGYSYNEYRTLKNNPNAAAEKEVSNLTDKIGKLIDLPSETPTVATVNDTNKLKEQPFFAKAENGDKVLIYTESRQAIIYREKSNKIINVGPIAIDAKDTDLPISKDTNKADPKADQ